VQTDPPDILIVEDEFLIGSLAEEALREAGFNASLVFSGEEALTLLEGSEAKYRALVTDINFGEGKMRGWELARHTREMRPEFPIVYISGGSPDDWTSKGVPNSIFVAKPFSAAEIITALSQLLNTGTAGCNHTGTVTAGT
jgi:DNA-binding response OmpR family regulator